MFLRRIIKKYYNLCPPEHGWRIGETKINARLVKLAGKYLRVYQQQYLPVLEVYFSQLEILLVRDRRVHYWKIQSQYFCKNTACLLHCLLYCCLLFSFFSY